MIHTLVMSTPVNAWTEGGIDASNRLTSDVALSSPNKTISSVFANGAATSAAIWKRKNLILVKLHKPT